MIAEAPQRPRPGRKELLPADRRIKVALWLTPTTVAALRAYAEGSETAGRAFERLVADALPAPSAEAVEQVLRGD